MNLELVRRWVRGELDPVERRQVGRWMLRSSDPHLPDIVGGLIREHEEETADEAVRSRLPSWGFVLDLWRRVVDAGTGTYEALSPVPAGVPVLGTAVARDAIGFREAGTEVIIDIRLAGTRRIAALLASTDRGDEHLLVAPVELDGGMYLDVARWTPDADEGRTTFWLVLSAAPSQEVRTLAQLQAALTGGRAEVVAARWTH